MINKIVKEKWFLLLAIVFVFVFMRLGFWQLDRAEQKKTRQAQLEERFAETPRSLCDYISAISGENQQVLDPQTKERMRYKPVSVQGRLSANYFLIDNQTYQGKVGYEVIQILHACDYNIAISRGFTYAHPDRSILPEIELYANELFTGSAYLYFPEDNVFIPSVKIERTSTWPQRIAQIDLVLMQQFIDSQQPVFPAVIRLKDSHALSLIPHWTLISMTPAKHYAYAIQWFSLAVLLIGLFLYATFKKDIEIKHEPTE